MNAPRPNVVIGVIGSRLDAGRKPARWDRWRPTVAACQQQELPVHRFELLHTQREAALAQGVAEDIREVSPATEVRLHEVVFRDAWDFEEVFGTIHQFASDYDFRTDKEEYLVHITTGSHVQQICLFLLTESRHLPGRLLQTSPIPGSDETSGTHAIIDLDLSRYDALAMRFAEEQQEGLTFLKSGIETRNQAFNDMIEQIERVVIASSAPLLITGPTGAGKSQLARRVYDLKRRRELVSGRFVEVNCATLRGDQAMSALFGHVKGAFTGASGARDGLLKSADRGVLFLDEIGELGADEQAMLLRAIEEKRFLSVGSDIESASDFQLIAGTNRDLQQGVKQGTFREDLLARINLWTFRIPGLAERREDIAPNLDYELARFTAAAGRKVTMNKEARESFLKFGESPEALWTANFRDLNASVTRMATLAPSGRITTTEVEEEIDRLRTAWGRGDETESLVAKYLSESEVDHLDLFDRIQLDVVLKVCQKSKSLSDAGRRLFAVSRQTKSQPNDADRLRKFLARFGLAWGDLKNQQ